MKGSVNWWERDNQTCQREQYYRTGNDWWSGSCL